MNSKPDVPVRSVRKALELLEMIVLDDPARNGIALTDLAKRMGMLPNSTRNILKTMLVCGFAAQNQEGRYVPGPKILTIGRINYFDKARLARIERLLLEFSGSIQEDSVFAILYQGRRIALAKAHSAQIIKIEPEKESADLYALPTGRVLAAYASPEELKTIVKLNGWPGKSWNNISNPAKMATAVSALKKAGGCVINPDSNQIASMAVPVLDAKDKLIGAIGAYAPCFRCPPEKAKIIYQELVKVAQRISAMQ